MDESPDWLSQMRKAREETETEPETEPGDAGATLTPEEEIPDWLRNMRGEPDAASEASTEAATSPGAADQLSSRLAGVEEETVEDDWMQQVRQRDAEAMEVTAATSSADAAEGFRFSSIHVLMLAVLLFLNVTILGCLFLLAMQKIVP